MPVSRGRRWVFTLNNPTDEEKLSVATFLNSESVKYGVVGRETGANGTPHLQGFFILNDVQRFNAVKRRVGDRCFLELARGTSQQARDYCKKDGDFDEYGEFPERGGRRADLEALFEWGDTFISTNGRAPTSPEIAQAQPAAYLRHPRICRLFQARAPPVQLREGEPRQWQRELAAELEGEADDRTVTFYVDAEGGKGKTWFQQWYLTNHWNDTQILTAGKRDDLAHSISDTKRIFFFNVPRTGMEYFQYPVCEMIKDQLVFSPKYNSRMKILPKPCHVIVFCNEMPDLSKMSADRYVIRTEFAE